MALKPMASERLGGGPRVSLSSARSMGWAINCAPELEHGKGTTLEEISAARPGVWGCPPTFPLAGGGAGSPAAGTRGARGEPHGR